MSKIKYKHFFKKIRINDDFFELIVHTYIECYSINIIFYRDRVKITANDACDFYVSMT